MRERPPAALEPALARRVLGALGVAAVLVGAAWLAAGAASAHSVYTPGRLAHWPAWLESPLAGLDARMGVGGFQALTLLLALGYALALAGARSLPWRVIAAAVLAAHVLFVLGPPLLSRDLVGYLAFARLGALHGLDPYSHVPAQAPGDPLYPFLSWPYQHTPYGPLFTLLSYAAVPLGVAGSLWALKALAALASLGAVALIARAARDHGRSGRAAAVLVGLNPVLLELGVGGDHNDTLALLCLSAALAAAALPRRAHVKSATAALVVGVAVKVSAGIALPYLLASRAPEITRARRMQMVAVAAGGLGLVALIAVATFGPHALGFLSAVHEQQRMVSPHSIPAETARLAGLHGVPAGLRYGFVAVFVAVALLALVRTARGADWRTEAGWVTIALVLCTAWLLPWYAIWPLPFAALSPSRRLRAATLAVCAYALAFHLPLAAPLWHV